MKKKIAIIGSTGSIGTTTLKIIDNNKKKFDVLLLSTNKNIKKLLFQANKFNVKNVIVTNKIAYEKIKKISKNRNIKIYNNYNSLEKIFISKVDYVMSSISGLDGLKPTIKIIKFTKNIAIANKETIICAWNLIKKELIKNNVNFFPVDSEHFSIWSLIKGNSINNIEEIYITASGGPFLNFSKEKLINISAKKAITHPNWPMGKKISIDSSNLINKVFEVIEARRIFDINYKKIKILIHPQSYLHGIIKFNNGITKLLVHDTDMKIPIYNSLYTNNLKISSNQIDLKKINNLNLEKPNIKKFKSLKLLKYIPNDISLYETALVSANDELVNHFLKGKIKYTEIIDYLFQIMKFKDILTLKRKKPKTVDQIMKLNEYVRLKTTYHCIK